MELQMSLVNSRIDDLRRTAREVHASAAPTAASTSLIGGLRRGLGIRLIAIGLALASPGRGAKAQPASMA